MSDRFRASGGTLAGALTLVVAIAFLIAATAVAQPQQSATKPAPKTPAAKLAWTKKTADGQPDLQGFWSSQTNTPLERDPSCGTKEFWTDEEIANGVRTCGAPAAAGRGQRAGGGQRGRGQRSNGEVDPHYDTAQFGLNLRTTAVNNRTSLITGPDGRIPSLSPIGEKRQAELAQQRTSFDSAESRPLTERCIVWNAQGPPMMSPATTATCKSSKAMVSS